MSSNPQKDQLPIPTPGYLRNKLLLRKTPFALISAGAILFTASLLPLAIIARARFTNSDQPRIHIIQDMGNQPRFSTQQPSPIFADGRASRPPVPGTVAQGMLNTDEHFDKGFTLVKAPDADAWQVKYFDTFPAKVTVDQRLMLRGQKYFNIYGAPCHGQDGYGNGAVSIRAIEKQEPKWVPPSNLHSDEIRKRADGHIYNTIRNGIRNMPGYASQIDAADRWAIVAYVRALQRSQNASVADVPEQERGTLR